MAEEAATRRSRLRSGEFREGDTGWQWESSVPKATLRSMLWEEEISLNPRPKPKTVYKMIPLFEQETDYKNWGDRIYI
jgi:hypothetical protein